LAALGYSESPKRDGVTLKFNHPIPVNQGRERKTIFADLVVYVDGTPVVVVDAKNPRSYLTENDREQVVSYARLLDNIAPYAALCNGGWQVFDTVRKQQIRNLPTRRDLVRDLQKRRLTTRQREGLVQQAKRTLFAIESVRELSRLMRRCHDVIRNLKGYDPTKAFDELSKVLFSKMYEERELAEGRRKVNRFSLPFVREMREQGVEIIQTLWQDTVGSDRFREVFADDSVSANIDLPPEAIDKIVALLEGKSLGLTDLDVKGVAFEEFLSSTYRGGGLGQYFTPREVVNFMVDLVDPAIGDKTIDPSCGSGGFLIRVYDVVREKILTSDLTKREQERRLSDLANHSLVGIDWEPRAARTCKMNMIIHGDGHAGVYHANALDISELDSKVAQRKRYYPTAPSVDDETFDIVLTNPPFGARDDLARIVNHYELGHGPQKREVLLLERQIRLLVPGGRLGVVIPEGILSNKNDSAIRDYILRECNVRAVIRLPQDAFKMSGGAACTSVLFAVKKAAADEEQGDIFFARAEYIGASPSGKPIPENDLLTIREAYRQFESGDWNGLEMSADEEQGSMVVRRAESEADLWLEPTVNRTSLLYDRLCYVVRKPKIDDRFSYTFFHPSYYRVINALGRMKAPTSTLADLCEAGYPVRGKKPAEEALDGIPIIKVRNVRADGIDLDTEFAPDQDATRAQAVRALLKSGDVLITSTGEGTIGKIAVYPYEDDAIADGHIAICRLKAGVNREYVVEFLKSELGQVQMLRYVSGSTGQTELLIDHVRSLRVPMPDDKIQKEIVKRMQVVRDRSAELSNRADALRGEGVTAMAVARKEMMELMTGDNGEDGDGAYQRFENLARRLVAVPRAEVPDRTTTSAKKTKPPKRG
jgi:type I restriction enzyme M protein